MRDEVMTRPTGRRRGAAPGGIAAETGSQSGVPSRRLNGTIVCVIDDLDGAEAALGVARWLAERFDVRTVLVSVDDLGGAVEAPDEEERVAAGDPAEAVARIAAEEAADLIVVGARRGLRVGTLRSLLAGDLAATASCPVVVAPPRMHGSRGNR